MELAQWIKEHPISTRMLYREAALYQCKILQEMTASGWNVSVVGSHHSKSITLPVALLEHPYGIQVYTRNNFFNWAVTVESKYPCVWDPSLVSFEGVNSVYFEGFDEAGIPVYETPTPHAASFFCGPKLSELLAGLLAQQMSTNLQNRL